MTQPDATKPAHPSATRSRRALRALLWVGGGILGLLLLLSGGALWWTGSQGSLRQALVIAQRFLPAGQSLEFDAVSGSLTRGGSIGLLRWSSAGTTITIEHLELQWQLRELLQRRLNVEQLQAELVHVRLQAGVEEPPGEPFVMPDSVQLPLQVTLPLQLARLQVERVAADGSSNGTAEFDTIAAGYRYDGQVHALALDSLHYGRSRAQARARLHATNLDLDAAVAASLRDLRADLPFVMLAHATAEGTLAGGDEAGITLRLDAREESGDAPVPSAGSLLESLAQLRTTLEDAADADAGNRAQVHVLTTVHPWRSQPVEQLDLQLSRFNLAAFHTAAPATRIGGSALVQPVTGAGGTWDLVAALRNGLPGRWDESRVPVSEVETRARLDPTHLRISQAQLVVAGPAPGGTITVQGEVPLDQTDQARLQLELQRLDLRQAHGQLPATDIGGDADVAPLAPGSASAGWQANLDLRNAAAGPLDRERLPLDAAVARLVVTPDLWRAQTLRLETGGGVLRMQGEYAPQTRTVDVQGELQRLPLRQIHRDLATDAAARLSGPLSVKGDLERGLDFDADITSDAADAPVDAPRADWEIRRVSARGRWSPTRLLVERVNVDAMQARIEGSDIDVTLPGLDSIQARVNASAPGLILDADAAMRQQSGGGKLALEVSSAGETLAWLSELPLVGGSLPPMQATGAVMLQADWEGGWRQWADGLARPARYPQLRLDANLATQDLALELPGEGEAEPTRISVQAFSTAVQGNLAAASLVVDGDVQVGDTATNLDIRVRMTRGAGQGTAPRWQFDVEQLQAAAVLPGQTGPWTLAVTEGLQVNLQTGNALQVESTAGELVLSPPAQDDARGQPLQVSWEPLQLSRTAEGATRVQSRGRIAGIQPGWLDTLRNEYDAGLLENAGLRTDLLLSGEWNLALGDTLAVDAHIQRDSGDLWLLGPDLRAEPAPLQSTPEDALAAGLRTIDLRVQSEGEEVAASLQWESQRAGNITARVATELLDEGGGWRLLPSAPVSGNIKAHLQDLGMWGIFAPPGWRVQGTLDADIELAGTVEEPEARGGIQGNALNVRSVLDGVELHQGTLRATLGGQQLRIEELAFQGGTGSKAYVSGLSGNRTQPPSARGSMRVGGVIDWSGIAQGGTDSGIRMDMQARLERMQVLVRNDRQLSLSGDLSAALAEGALRVRGDLRVDRATILLPDAGAPTLGDDVIVVRDDDPLDLVEVTAGTGASGELETAKPMDLEIKLDLGRDLALHGHGITTRLEGELTVQSSGNPGQPFSVYGEVRTVEGRYRAWGQALNVETGIVAFNGSYLNPALNLLAIRPEIDVRAGVRVTGTLSAPRVELYSDPPLPEAEKLSWVVLGRASAIGGAEGTSMQRAALGLLAGTAVSGLADDLGVDELGLEESAVSIGKRITDELYVTYEAGLSGAASTLFIFYDITRRFTIRGETGEASAVDLIYTIEFD